MSGICIKDLNKWHGPLHVLQSIDLQIDPGEFIVLLGPSGCGKSTLLNAIAGLEPINSGSIDIGGTDVTDVDPSRRGIAMVFQSYALYPTMSVRKNLSFGLTVNKVPKATINERVHRVAKMLQIESYLDRKPAALSGGQRQRVAIGRALVRESSVCLFDEPLSNLDAKLRTETRGELKRLHASLGATMLYVTHDQIEAMTLATRVAVMKGGRVEQYAPPEELYERPATLFVAGFVGSPSMSFLQATLNSDRTLDFGSLSLDMGAYPFTAPMSGKVVLGLRPEHITIVEDPSQRGIDVTTLFIEPMGADTLCWFEVEGQKFSARLNPVLARTLGKTARVQFALERASLFDAATEKRI